MKPIKSTAHSTQMYRVGLHLSNMDPALFDEICTKIDAARAHERELNRSKHAEYKEGVEARRLARAHAKLAREAKPAKVKATAKKRPAPKAPVKTAPKVSGRTNAKAVSDALRSASAE